MRDTLLDALGTGIHELIILAAAATAAEKKIICLEEPEIHLHPLQQRKLLRYLVDETDNQYFIATHSAHILDTPDAIVFHVRMEKGSSRVERIETAGGHTGVCDDLGYRASDLLQANCVVWVEGPSDRIYLNHWLNSIAQDLVEGIHYQIMFYGGRLLSHLSGEESGADEFIKLRSLNRHPAILIDSDKASASARLNATKKRVVSEFQEEPGLAWVTKGREVENYVHTDLMEQAISVVKRKAVKTEGIGQFDRVLALKRKIKGKTQTLDKIKIARAVTTFPADLNVLDLATQIKALARYIRGANSLA